MTRPEPVAFDPILVEKVWGGERLEQMFRGRSSGVLHGEAWCLSPLPDRPSKVVEGPLAGATSDEVLADWHRIDPAIPASFPVLIKFLEAQAPLSVQLHPSDERARELGDGCHGKAEAWQVLACDPGTKVLHGLLEDVDAPRLRRILEEDPEKVLDFCRHLPVSPGDVFAIPPGVVHSITGSMVWVEVQQASDVTYRLYDWGRTGTGRALHPDKAVRSARYGVQPEAPTRARSTREPGSELLWASPWFVMMRRKVAPGPFEIRRPLEAWVCLEGSGVLHTDGGTELEVRPGRTFLLPGRDLGGRLDAEADVDFLVVTQALPEAELHDLLDVRV